MSEGSAAAGHHGRRTVGAAALDIDAVVADRSGRRILRGVSLTVHAGEVCGLLGPNGVGKTTLLKVISGLVAPDEGSVQVLGRSVKGGAMPPGLGALIEEPRFYPWLTGRDNLRVFSAGDARRGRRIDDLLDEVGLGDRGGDRVTTYSQGMRQRLGIARALGGEPRVLVLDEPTNGLDPEGYSWIRQLLRRLADAEVAVLVTSHVLAEVQRFCDSVVIMADGRVVLSGSVEAVLNGRHTLEEVFFDVAGEPRDGSP